MSAEEEDTEQHADNEEEEEEEEEVEEEEEESEELQQDNAASNNNKSALEPAQIPDNDKQRTVDIHTDDDYYSDGSMIENEDIAPLGAHKRTGSYAEKRESIHQQKRAMEERLRTLSQKLDQELDTALDEFTEMEQINEDKQIFGDLFDKIDPDDNGDVDEKEWCNGLKRLNVDITEEDMSKMFKLMDGDKSGYIDRQDWITFCMTSYNSKELQRLHDSVLRNIKGHSRKPSNMINAKDAGDWSVSAMHNLEKQMTKAFLQQGAEEVHKQEEEEEYFIDMERQAENNPDWGKPERALEWTPKEVAFWLDSIELSQYARKFDEEQLDGSILCNDCDRDLLQREMGIKPLHVGKILREVDKLRKLNKDKLTDSTKDWNELSVENKILIQRLEDQQKEMEEQQKLINELQTENAALKLRTMTGAGGGGPMVPPMADDATGPTTKGLDDVEVDDTMGIGMGLAGEFKTDFDPHTEIKVLRAEIEHLRKQKILFAQNTANEILNLRQVIKVMSHQYTAATTPYYKKFNPIDGIIRSLGYTPTDQ